MIKILPFILPVILAIVAWNVWLTYVTRDFISKLEWTLLEIKIPREVFKSPLAMELIFSGALYQAAGPGKFDAKYWDGKVFLWHTLEIVSIEGRIHFLVRVPKKPTDMKKIFESHIYSQFPQAEVSEIEDYTKRYGDFDKDTSDFKLWGSEFVLAKDDYLPIKTYLDYGFDQKTVGSMEGNQIIDPISTMVEYFSSIGEGEEIWFQIHTRINTERYQDPTKNYGYLKFEKIAKEGIKKLKEDGVPKNVIDSAERNASKYQFDVGIRTIYIAKKDKYNKSVETGLGGIMRAYTDNYANSFKNENGTNDGSANEMLRAYKLRSYFYWPHNFKRKIFALSAEELATIFHFPGSGVETPSFEKIDSRKEGPPANLPI